VSTYKKWQKNQNGEHGLPHIITTNIEHPSIEKPLMKLKEEGVIGNKKANRLKLF